ncbi:MAG TPA: type II toxin-antitoxin system VapC family toxin [Rhizomicrobium sp.]|nr:type II toxin-antitoxin system VapC family toxin [Rhizomicrobium sp.]
MIGLDTNILMRYFAQDDPKQSPAATRLLEDLTSESPGLIPAVVLAETVWVMEDVYGADRTRIAAIVESLLRTSALIVQDSEAAWRALSRYRARSADFADCLVERTCAGLGCRQIFTFDKRAARDAGMTLVG